MISKSFEEIDFKLLGVKVKNGKVTGEIQYLNALEEEKFNIAHAGMMVLDDGTFIHTEAIFVAGFVGAE